MELLITAKNVTIESWDLLKTNILSTYRMKTIIEWITRDYPEYEDVLFTTEAPIGNVNQLLTKNRIAASTVSY